jgi:hypothetical protein
MIKGDALADDDWPNSLRKYWRYVDDNPGSTIGWVPGLRPVRGRAPIDGSVVAVLELLALLQLSDRDLIFHTISIKEFR